jgi:hypothetical protein
MKSPSKLQIGILMVFFLLAFTAGAAVINIYISAADAAFVQPIYAGIFLLTAVFYLSPAYPWFSRAGLPRLIGLILILVVPALLLHIWMAFVRDYRVASLVWLAPFMGMGVGLNLRIMRGKVSSPS